MTHVSLLVSSMSALTHLTCVSHAACARYVYDIACAAHNAISGNLRAEFGVDSARDIDLHTLVHWVFDLDGESGFGRAVADALGSQDSATHWRFLTTFFALRALGGAANRDASNPIIYSALHARVHTEPLGGMPWHRRGQCRRRAARRSWWLASNDPLENAPAARARGWQGLSQWSLRCDPCARL